MLKVALTGNIASGKSTVADTWRALGARLVDADELARLAVEPGTPALREIVERWGGRILDHEGRLDRVALRAAVFDDPEQRAALERIVHPRVQELREREFARAEAEGARVVVAEIPLLFEVGLQESFDLLVLVDAPEELRLQRIVRDRGLGREEAKRMIAAQMPSADKRGRSDFVIDNTGTVEQLRAEAERVWWEILRHAGEKR